MDLWTPIIEDLERNLSTLRSSRPETITKSLVARKIQEALAAAREAKAFYNDLQTAAG